MAVEKIKGITGDMFGCKARGVNMRHPVEIRSILVRSKTTDGFSTLSLKDEKDNILLQIEVNDDVKEIFKKIMEE